MLKGTSCSSLVVRCGGNLCFEAQPAHLVIQRNIVPSIPAHQCNTHLHPSLGLQVVKSAKQTQARKAKASGAGYADEDTKPAEQPKKYALPAFSLLCSALLCSATQT